MTPTRLLERYKGITWPWIRLMYHLSVAAGLVVVPALTLLILAGKDTIWGICTALVAMLATAPGAYLYLETYLVIKHE
jgi:hypothetical protein